MTTARIDSVPIKGLIKTLDKIEFLKRSKRENRVEPKLPIHIYFSEKSFSEIKKQSVKSGLSISAYCRMLMNDGLKYRGLENEHH